MKKITVTLLFVSVFVLCLFGHLSVFFVFAAEKTQSPSLSKLSKVAPSQGSHPLAGKVSTIPGRTALREALLQDTLLQVKIDRKIEHSGLVVSALLLSAENDLRRGDLQSSISKANKAIAFSSESPLPHFFLAHIYRLSNTESILNVLGEYATGIRLSISNFWIFTSSLGIVGLVLMLTFHLCLLTFLLYSFVYYVPLWVHYAKERLPAHVHHNVILSIIIVFLLAFFFLLPPFWSLFIALFFFWFFYRPREKIVAVVFLIGMLFFSFLLKPLLIILTAKQSYLLDQMAANEKGDFIWSAPQFNSAENEGCDPCEECDPAVGVPTCDWKISFIKASYATQEKHLGEAEAFYKQALLQNQDEKRLLNNLGNIAFYRENFKEALGYYQKAIDQDPNYVVAHYNMGQVNNELLAFEKGKDKYIEAKKINQSLTEYYAQSAAKYPNHPVIEERFTQMDLWRHLFLLYWDRAENIQSSSLSASSLSGRGDGIDNIRQFWVGRLTFIPFLILSILMGGGLFFACLKLKKYVSCEFCPTCHRAMCIQCQESFTNYNLCGDCSTLMVTGNPPKQVGVLIRIMPFFVVPGGFHLVMQKPIFALSLLVPFYFCVMLMAVGDVFLPSASWHLSIASSPLLPITIVFLYAVYLLDIYLKRGR